MVSRSDFTFVMPNVSAQRLKALVKPLEDHTPEAWQSCQNLNLLLHKYVPKEVIAKPTEGDPLKGTWLKQVAQTACDEELRREWHERWDHMVRAHGAIPFTKTCGWRMVVGLGGASPVETDLLTHWVYGIPYIPGSAVKGLTRAYATANGVDEKTLVSIFGSQEQSGSIIFFDAIPADTITLKVDIMNPHYPDYYGGNEKAPSNDQNPIPVYFLAVEETMFSFALATRTKEQAGDDVVTVQGWLKKALRVMGIGGKTSAGYGHFE